MTDPLRGLSLDIAGSALLSLPGALQVYRLDGTTGAVEWIFLHPHAEALFGLPLEEIRAGGPAKLGELVHPDDQAHMNAHFMHGIQTLEDVQYQIRVLRPDGTTAHLETNHHFERTEDGSTLCFGYSLDIGERARMQAGLEASRKEALEREALFRKMFDALPVGVSLMRPDGSFPFSNLALQKMVPLGDEDRAGLRFEEQNAKIRVMRTDGSPFPVKDQPIARVMAGANQASDEFLLVVEGSDAKPVRMSNSALALYDASDELEYVLTVGLDVTAQRELEEEVQQRNAQLAASEADKIQLIERLRHAVDELSTPILEVWDEVLLMPIIGLVDSKRAADMVTRLLDAVVSGNARYVIIDLTGVEIVDTRTADHLIRLVKKVELVGARCVLTGIRPAVAQTLVDIGIDFGRLTTLRNLKHGLRDALASRREWQESADDVFEHEHQPRAPRRTPSSR